ncbi:hypothetical protein AFK68_03545 [Hydrocoleum sp. CS-953]|nr:hypothetical protein AFK68_03545 [Hydrocoleum sp. CS-953]
MCFIGGLDIKKKLLSILNTKNKQVKSVLALTLFLVETYQLSAIADLFLEVVQQSRRGDRTFSEIAGYL